MNQLLHTPDGVRDIFGRECDKKEAVEEKLTLALKRFGYQRIDTPTFEYFDIFGSDIGTTPSRELYKFFDREGNTLVLRPDMTPQIARAWANYFAETKASGRLYYAGNVFRNHSSLQGRLKESTQIGAELIGDPSPDADAEMIALCAEMLSSAGLSDYMISIGHAGLFAALAKESGLDEEETKRIRTLICNKNFFGLEEALIQKGVGEELRSLFACMGRIFNEPDEWNDLRQTAAAYPGLIRVLDYFNDLYGILGLYGLQKQVSFEWGLLSRYGYYTGILFAGYTYGTGKALLSGGRYDDLLTSFGHEAPAIGFAISSDDLLSAMERQKIAVPDESVREVILYAKDKRADAILAAKKSRREGNFVTLLPLPEDEKTRSAVTAAYTEQKNSLRIME